MIFFVEKIYTSTTKNIKNNFFKKSILSAHNLNTIIAV